LKAISVPSAAIIFHLSFYFGVFMFVVQISQVTIYSKQFILKQAYMKTLKNAQVFM
jgi:hypothetical protein